MPEPKPRLIQLSNGDWIDPTQVTCVRMLPRSTPSEYLHSPRVLVDHRSGYVSHLDFESDEDAVAYRDWLAAIVNGASNPCEDDPDEETLGPDESQMTSLWIWVDESGEASFDKSDQPAEIVEVAIPGNWRLKSYRSYGLMLVEFWSGDAFDAIGVVGMAEADRYGFKVQNREKRESVNEQEGNYGQ